MRNRDSIIYPLKSFNYDQATPLMVTGNGVNLYDELGNHYIDAISGLWNVSFGYSNVSVNEAVIRQINKLSYINLINNCTSINIKYANNLVAMLPDKLSKLVYTCSGSESIEVAIKLSRKYNKLKKKSNKNKIVVLNMSYHGTTYAAMSASGMDTGEAYQYAPIVDGFISIETPFCTCCNFEDMDPQCRKKSSNNLEETFKINGDNIAAIIIEPVVGSGGIVCIPKWYIEQVKKLCDQYDVLMIFDEVATGFGRTGLMFAFERYGIEPDILCLSKSINNGIIPMGVTIFNEKINNYFCNNNQFIEHFSTQNGNPLACVAAQEVLNILSNSQLLNEINEKSTYFKQQLDKNLYEIEVVRQIRCSGLMIGIDLINFKKRSVNFNDLEKILDELRKKGLIVYIFHIEGIASGISLLPAYVITFNEIDKIVKILKMVLSKILL